MRSRSRCSFFVLLIAIFGIAACSPQSTQEPPAPAPTTVIEPGVTLPPGALPQTEAQVPRVTVEEARAALESGAAVIVDVRSPAASEESRVRGAVSVPLGTIERDLESVPLSKEQWIITYCT